MYGDDFDKSFLKIFKHCIDLNKGGLNETDYNFWAVIFEDENGLPLHRQDMLENEINNNLKSNDPFIKIWRTFDTEKKPVKWIVWPHSTSKGWLNKIEGRL